MGTILYVDAANGTRLFASPLDGAYPIPQIGTTVRYTFTPRDEDHWDPAAFKENKLAGEGAWYVQSVTHDYKRFTVQGALSYTVIVGLSRQCGK